MKKSPHGWEDELNLRSIMPRFVRLDQFPVARSLKGSCVINNGRFPGLWIVAPDAFPTGTTSVAFVLCYPNTVTGSCRTLTCFPFTPAPHKLCTPESVCCRAPLSSSIHSIYSTLDMYCQGCQRALNPCNIADFGSFEDSELVVNPLNISLFKKCVSYG